MATAKEEVAELLRRLPDDCTLEDIQYHLYVLEKIRRGVDDADAGRVQSQEQVEARFAEWLDK
jgi:predicted transcriptional regulator